MNGQDLANPATVQAVPYFQPRLDVTEYLMKAVAGHPQTTWTGLVTGVIYDWVSLPNFRQYNPNGRRKGGHHIFECWLTKRHLL